VIMSGTRQHARNPARRPGARWNGTCADDHNGTPGVRGTHGHPARQPGCHPCPALSLGWLDGRASTCNAVATRAGEDVLDLAGASIWGRVLAAVPDDPYSSRTSTGSVWSHSWVRSGARGCWAKLTLATTD